MISLRVDVGRGHLEIDNRATRAVFRAAGAEIARLARQLIRSSAGGGRLYYGAGGSAASYRGGYVRGRHQASTAGSAPTTLTGTLARSIVVRPFKSGEGVAIRDRAFYGLFLESGANGGGRIGPRGAGKKRGRRGISKTRRMEPRPYLSTVLERRGPSIGPRIAAALASGVKFVRER